MWAATEAIGRLTSVLEEQRLGKKLDLLRLYLCGRGI